MDYCLNLAVYKLIKHDCWYNMWRFWINNFTLSLTSYFGRQGIIQDIKKFSFLVVYMKNVIHIGHLENRQKISKHFKL